MKASEDQQAIAIKMSLNLYDRVGERQVGIQLSHIWGQILQRAQHVGARGS